MDGERLRSPARDAALALTCMRVSACRLVLTEGPRALDASRLRQAAKGTVGGLHFLAIQTDAEAETCTGFWMLRDTSKNI